MVFNCLRIGSLRTYKGMDSLSKEQRHRCMASVRAKGTKPELSVRKALTMLGFRYRLNYSTLPGKPDIAITRFKIAIFVNGCYWHRHGCKQGRSMPASNVDYWKTKLQRNVERDKRNYEALTTLGWHIIVIWECQTKKADALDDILKKNVLPLVDGQ